jgi:secondary thiamine-phosphate synthase enzyme
MRTIIVETSGKDQVLDITERVAAVVREESAPGRERKASGACLVFAAHTTCAITTADLDPGTDRDLLQALRSLLGTQSYRHPHNPSHAPDHILSSLVGPSILVPYADGALLLGTWQRVVLVELDGPRQRTLHIGCL